MVEKITASRPAAAPKKAFMRIAIIAPYSTGPMRGNITTVKRISRGFIEAGADVTLLPMDTTSPAGIREQIDSYVPDVIHAFHAGICGEVASNLAEQLGVPCVITITGSDINEVRFRDTDAMKFAMARATAIACFDTAVSAKVTRYFPAASGRIAIIPQGIAAPPCSRLSWPGISPDDFVLLLPAAIRPVKNILFPLAALAPLIGDLPKLKLVVAGGVIDSGYAAIVSEEIAASPHAVWLGEVPHEQMGSLYARADLVLNCSAHEEMPNSLLEAMALGRPVLAADIPGNQVLVRSGETGWLYRSEDEFRSMVMQLARDAALRSDTGRRAREYVLSHFSPHIEAKLYLELFRKLVSVHHP